MRSLILIESQKNLAKGESEELMFESLQEMGFRPQKLNFSAKERDSILGGSAHLDSPTSSDQEAAIANQQAAEILVTIPVDDQERQKAIQAARFAIEFQDATHAITNVGGLVCVTGPKYTVRWRHKVSRSLEKATEEFVAKVWEKSGPDKSFREFTQGHMITVREPVSTSDVYTGEILPPGPKLKELARRGKSIELRIAYFSFLATVTFLAIGYFLYWYSEPNSPLRWWSGTVDRLSTTAAATSAVSYLNYLFHLHELQQKPIIDWK